MAIVTHERLLEVLKQLLSDTGFSESEAALCAKIFADSTVDGYHSHGVNRFEAFLSTITDGYVQLGVKPERELALGSFERWNGKLGPGPLIADFCTKRAIALAKESGMGCVALQNGSHWMRGGTYGWQAAEAGCIALCFTNTCPNMPSWGAKEANTGNNPVIVSVPRAEGHIVLDMALSQFSYGKMERLVLNGEALPFPGGYNAEGELTNDPKAILDSQRLLPTGYWKGSGLSILVDLLVTLLSSGRSTAKIGEMEVEYGLSQVFICFDAKQMNGEGRHKALVDEIIRHVMNVAPAKEGGSVDYPGSRTVKRREKHMKEGIPIHDEVWDALLERVS
ncbi:3-dehydro-L-gulonate 2-dehydrogenase [Aggregatimonas sangjinii]|uniref:3-dehydro-L-gulonate 2-dehydrogenase n=1 Tax=Aggregatimonas sangjinii TaxID=2583587 RepID=A0A5B7SV32_9FLAO|nr:3-dehydro-L-gulonate 2-dehydrogenase [Aggregatimonas sangjinii]QCX00690.1 3-dehydro-L-gulonate 2-dehydrogenase [Aggregatimonas sangjinii]